MRVPQGLSTLFDGAKTSNKTSIHLEVAVTSLLGALLAYTLGASSIAPVAPVATAVAPVATTVAISTS